MSDLQVVTFKPEAEQYAWTFGGVPPVARIKPPVVLEVFTEDAFFGRVRSEDDLVSEVCEFPFVNPQTGPFYIDDAEPGDTLAVHFVSITPARDWGASTTIPLFGALTNTHLTALLNEPLPELVWMYQLDRAGQTCRFTARHGDFTVDLPMNPMHGTVGGVNVAGALFSLGDGHARQGEGETCGVAVETAMNTVMVVDLIKGTPCPWPRLENDGYVMTAGSARPLEDAFRIAQTELVLWLAGQYGMDTMDAYQLVSQGVEAPLANVVDVNYTSVAKMPKRYLPGAPVMGGAHSRLRELAAQNRA